LIQWTNFDLLGHLTKRRKIVNEKINMYIRKSRREKERNRHTLLEKKMRRKENKGEKRRRRKKEIVTYISL